MKFLQATTIHNHYYEQKQPILKEPSKQVIILTNGITDGYISNEDKKFKLLLSKIVIIIGIILMSLFGYLLYIIFTQNQGFIQACDILLNIISFNNERFKTINIIILVILTSSFIIILLILYPEILVELLKIITLIFMNAYLNKDENKKNRTNDYNDKYTTKYSQHNTHTTKTTYINNYGTKK